MENKLSKLGYLAVNVYFSGACNLQCTYCFQPKIGSHMGEVNKEIIKWISSGKMEDDIIKYIGEDIESISLWGGEPSINLPYLTERMESVLSKFPKLKSIFYSTNMSTPKLTENTRDFIWKCAQVAKALDRPFKNEVQISIDGVPSVNDQNRVGSSGNQIVKNITWLLKDLKEKGITNKELSTNFKATHGSFSMDYLNRENHLYEHYKYFDNLYSEWRDICDFYPRGGEVITVVYPGQFSQQDGYNFRDITKKLLSKEFRKELGFKNNLRFETQVSSRIIGSIETTLKSSGRDFKGELLSCSTCSAGRSCAGITYKGMFHWCQATYFFDKETRDYIKQNNLVTDFEANQGFSFRNFDNFVDKVEAVDYNNKLDLTRSLMIPALFRATPEMRISYLSMMVYELASAGLISKCFMEQEWIDLVVNYLIFGGNECIADNVWEFGSIWIKNISVITLVCNGAFELIMEDFKKRYGKSE